MSRHRLTPRKKAFAEALIVSGLSQVEAARAAGYSQPENKASGLMLKDKSGRLKDRALAGYIAELSAHPTGIPKDLEVVGGAVPEAEQTGDGDEIVQQLFQIMRNAHEPGGTRIRAAEILLKALGKDRPDGSVEADLDDAVNAVRRLLGQ